jgi:hypothetical protein
MNDPITAGLSRLLRSSKGLLLLGSVAGVVVMNVVGRIDGERALTFIQWLVGFYFGAVAIEDGASKLRGSPPAPSAAPPAPPPDGLAAQAPPE